MHKKVYVGIFMFLLILAFPLSIKAVGNLYVDPSTTLTSVGDIVSVNITISDVSDLAGWEFKLYYLSSELNGTSIVEGPFLKQGGSTYFDIINFTDNYNSTHGLAWATCVLLGEYPGVTGSGVLAAISFKAKQSGTSPLHLVDTLLVDSQPEPQPIPHTVLNGIVFILSHNVAITNVTSSKTVVGQELTVKIDVNVVNQGNFTETFNITAYANTTLIDTLLNITLTSGNSTTITFTWNTTDVAKGNYTIKAYSNPVARETDLEDNTFVNGVILITIPGDVDGDIDVDLYDVVKICSAYGSNKGEPGYEANYDVNGDNKIDLYDAAIACTNYGKTL